jgi:hypothetical protein
MERWTRTLQEECWCLPDFATLDERGGPPLAA